MYKYTLGLLALVFLSFGCSKDRVEIGGISNRQQLDSIIALFSSDSIEVDSFPHRALWIKLRGELSLHGIPIKSVEFDLKKEELKKMRVEFATDACLSLLNAEESLHGLGEYSSGSFTWNADFKEISLQPVYSGRWTYEAPEPLFLSDTLGFNYTVSFAGSARNKITELYKEQKPNDNFPIYSLETSFYSSINYKVYLNGCPVKNLSDDRINDLLPWAGNQEITVEFLPPFDKVRDADAYIKRLTGGGEQLVYIYKESNKGGDRTLVKQIVVDTDIDKKGVIQSYVVNMRDIPYYLDYMQGIDLRRVNNLKALIYSHYTSLKEVVESGNSAKLIEMIYPMERNEALAYNKDAIALQYRWAYMELMMDENEGVDLMNLADLEVEYAAGGRLARLVPKQRKEDETLLAAQVYMIGDSPRNIAYYVYMDKNNEINFALR